MILSIVIIITLVSLKKYIILKLIFFYDRYSNRLKEILFYFACTINSKKNRLFIVDIIIKLYTLVLSFLIINILMKILQIKFIYLILIVILGITVTLSNAISRIQKTKVLLIEDISKFVFKYELELLRGQNQISSLKEASGNISFIDIYSDVDEYIDSFNELFRLSKLMLIKRLSLIIERNKMFTTQKLSLEFLELNEDIFDRYYRNKKIEIEKKENLIILPMIGNMIAMMIYAVSPFVMKV